MGKAEGSWSGMRKYLEQEMLAEPLRGRVRYRCTTYVGMDGCHIFELFIDGRCFKRFSWETVNGWFYLTGHAQKDPPMSIPEYWAGYQSLLQRFPMDQRTEYEDNEFSDALRQYRVGSIRDSLHSPDPIVRMFALLDRRVGQRTLKELKAEVSTWPEWLQALYSIRVQAANQQEA